MSALAMVSYCKLSNIQSSDYEQQRRHLMRKHGVDLDDGQLDGAQTRRMDRREIEALIGDGGQDQSGIFTWRDKNRRKVR